MNKSSALSKFFKTKLLCLSCRVEIDKGATCSKCQNSGKSKLVYIKKRVICN